MNYRSYLIQARCAPPLAGTAMSAGESREVFNHSNGKFRSISKFSSPGANRGKAAAMKLSLLVCLLLALHLVLDTEARGTGHQGGNGGGSSRKSIFFFNFRRVSQCLCCRETYMLCTCRMIGCFQGPWQSGSSDGHMHNGFVLPQEFDSFPAGQETPSNLFFSASF